jgi:hypothetical protein
LIGSVQFLLIYQLLVEACVINAIALPIAPDRSSQMSELHRLQLKYPCGRTRGSLVSTLRYNSPSRLSEKSQDMIDQAYRAAAVDRESAIESLARETNTPLDTVREIYRLEHDKLERSARVKTFVPVLAHRRVKARLQERGEHH